MDSCKPLTQDPTGSTGLYPQVSSAYGGAPEFWGRYLTTTYNCAGLSSTEIAAAQAHHPGILPIYDDYDCSGVSGYATGLAYAATVSGVAAGDGIPQGTGIAVDIEPPGPYCSGNVDTPLIEGWYDGITNAGYVPVFYGDTTGGSNFGRSWCAAVATTPNTRPPLTCGRSSPRCSAAIPS